MVGLVLGCAGPVTPPSISSGLPSAQPLTSAIVTPSDGPEPPSLPSGTLSASWTVTAGGDAAVYHYVPAALAVPANRPVTIRFVDADVVDHTWTVFDRDGVSVLANLSVAKEGDAATATFTFPNPGTYSFWCTIPGHKGFGEVGSLTVVP